ncbi:MAG: polyphosphate polymerase domain-containing protein [Eubacteriales bacterium]|nr:polyphosphate polymerase domain-containing protein [Eubacteriales bacterium]
MKPAMNYRHEYKYVCTAVQAEIIKCRIKGIMKIDDHAFQNGSYNIRSLYFDDVFHTAYYANENGTEPRDKFRLRVYNNDMTGIFLEKKQKCRGMTMKDSCRITIAQAEQLIAGQEIALNGDSPQLLLEFAARSQRQKLHPVVIVDYDRIPYVYQLGNVRVTFDRNIASSNQISRFFEKDIAKRLIMESGQQVMEVKWDQFLPDYIKQCLQTNGLPRTALSKYYYCSKYNLSSGVLL